MRRATLIRGHGWNCCEREPAIREAIEFHPEGMKEDGTPISPPSTRVDYVDVAA
jgi:hypothetical protein